MHACVKGHRAWLVAPKRHEQLEAHALRSRMFPLRQRGPGKGHGHSQPCVQRGICRTSMTTICRTVPTSKGGHCRYPCRPGALRPGLGLPLSGPPAIFSSGPQVRLPTSAAPTTSTVKQEEPEVPNKGPQKSSNTEALLSRPQLQFEACHGGSCRPHDAEA